MTNEKRIIKALDKISGNLGIYSVYLNKLNANNLKKVLDSINYGSDTDIKVFINRKPYIIEICWFYDEVDFYCKDLEEYIDLYGEEYREKFE